ncbi:MAG: ATP-binding protein, partial [Oscillospiraceae bacterium]
MERIYNSELQSRLEVYIAQGHSQEETSKLIGVTGGLLSAYRKSNYNGNIANVENKIKEFFKISDAGQAQAEKAQAYRPIKNYIPTSISEEVYKMIEYCQIEKGMVVIHGDAGIGKTKGAEKYVLENTTNAIYIQVSPAFGSLGSFLKILARELKIPETRSKLDLVLQ